MVGRIVPPVSMATYNSEDAKEDCKYKEKSDRAVRHAISPFATGEGL